MKFMRLIVIVNELQDKEEIRCKLINQHNHILKLFYPYDYKVPQKKKNTRFYVFFKLLQWWLTTGRTRMLTQGTFS